MSFNRNNKYHAIATTFDGKRYDSKAEAKRAWELSLLFEQRQIKCWERQVWFQLCDAFRYRVDFVVTALDGTQHAEDVKGANTSRWRDVRKHWAVANPMPLIVLRSHGNGWHKFRIGKDGKEEPFADSS